MSSHRNIKGQGALNQARTIELDITDLAYGGDGVGRTAGRACFIPFTLPGERVQARLTQETKRYARAKVIKILTPSPERVQPVCPYFYTCGGCQYQHLDYAAQVRWKHKQVADLLARIGGFCAPPLEPMRPSPRPYGYRNKITLHGPGQPALRTLASQRNIAVAHCPLATAPINTLLWAKRQCSLASDEHLVIRSNLAGTARWFTEIGGRRTASDGHPAWITDQIIDQEYAYPLTSFFQVNPEVLNQILAMAALWLKTQDHTLLIDAYCGVGVFILALTRRHQLGIGIEVDGDAVAAAKANAARQAIHNVTFRQGKAELCVEQALREAPAHATCLILDPPRAGCAAPVLRAITRYRPRHLLYLSCVPPILARDLKLLAQAGYQLVRVQPFDMFPQTAHIECLAELALSAS